MRWRVCPGMDTYCVDSAIVVELATDCLPPALVLGRRRYNLYTYLVVLEVAHGCIRLGKGPRLGIASR